ncbi:Hcp family type VI secretion system effector [Janthinobacterium aquaticum]|uniref:Hcp family type VI secretion system effector n=1 Tax=Janthinobacterium sp. FT58W TaxID=2654254 RepID=UPI001264DA00|nr:type VI secretion system tube protein Hcp [Janthinobacterium sp. FT58W]KAB8042696.1 Hcp1 family type VI secretion system effector [Janthinobacterium sp. FT58W]
MNLILLQPGNPALLDALSDVGDMDRSKWAGMLPDCGPCIELISVHQGMKQQVSTDVSNSARTSGRPILSEFTLTKYIDRTSVNLYGLCLRAEPLGKGASAPTRLHIMRAAGEQPASLITFALRDAIISEIQFQTHPNDMPTEQFKLSFTEILWTYDAQQSRSKGVAAQTTGWSVLKNRSIEQFTN